MRFAFFAAVLKVFHIILIEFGKYKIDSMSVLRDWEPPNG